MLKINYADPGVAKEILERLWKPFIERYIGYGFCGVRIDAIKHIDPTFLRQICSFIYDCCVARHSTPPVLFGELLYGEHEGGPETFEPVIRGIGLSHVLNFLPDENFLADQSQSLIGWVGHRIGLHRSYLVNGNPGFLGGTISCAGNHDKGTLTARLSKCSGLPAELLSKKKEFLFFTAFTSDGGWYALSGDECGYNPDRKCLTFRGYKPPNWAALLATSESGLLTPFIQQINACLGALPPLVGEDPGFWVERFWFEHAGHPLVAVVRHYPGHPHEVIMADCSTSMAVGPFNQEALRAFFEAQVSAGGALAKAVIRGERPYSLSLIAHDGFARIPYEATSAMATVAADDEALTLGK